MSAGMHIAWLGPMPGGDGGVGGVATDLLDGLASLGHRIDCFLVGSPQDLPARLTEKANLDFVRTSTNWTWDRWYSRNNLSAFVTGLWSRAWAFHRLRRAVVERHAHDPYDCIYQFSNIETFGVPWRLASSVPLVMHPETHMAGELRWFVAERRIARQCESWHRRLMVGSVLVVRAIVQRRCIHRAKLLICISGVFRDHMVADYRFPRTSTCVIPNPVRLNRFGAPLKDEVDDPPTILILGRISVRKGVEQIAALSHVLAERGVRASLRIVGGHSLQSDYRPLLRDMNPTNTTYVGFMAPEEIPNELARADMLVQASKYEPFGLTVAEALAAGVPVVATYEVGAVEGTSTDISTEVVPVGDVDALAAAVEQMLERLREDTHGVRLRARRDAERLFAPDIVCRSISGTLEELVGMRLADGQVNLRAATR